VTSTVVHGDVSGFPLPFCFFFTTWHPPGCCEGVVGALWAGTCADPTATQRKHRMAARTIVKSNPEIVLGKTNPGVRSDGEVY
jgi:hypothetical protein